MLGPRGRFDDPVLDGEPGQAGYIVQIELAHQVCAVVFGRLDTDVEDLGNLLRAVAFGDQLEDFPFPGGEPLQGRRPTEGRVKHGMAKDLSHLGAEVGAAGGDNLEPFLEFREGSGFSNEPMRAGLDQLTQKHCILIPGKDEDMDIRELAPEAAEDFRAIEPGKHDVEDDEIRFGFEALIKSLPSVAALGDDIPAVHGFDNLGNHVPNGGVIFNYGDLFHHGIGELGVLSGHFSFAKATTNQPTSSNVCR